MLPDFAAMIGARPPLVEHLALQAGVDYHHRTDHVFHEARDFRALVHEAFDSLLARGVARGSARAVAHVGIEILLDDVLARDPVARHAYLDALCATSSLQGFIEWPSSLEHERFEALCSGLAARGISSELAAPNAVAARLTRALARRPRLALNERAQPLIREWIVQTVPRVQARAGTLIDELRRSLAASAGGVERTGGEEVVGSGAG